MQKGWATLLRFREKHLVSLTPVYPLSGYSCWNMSVAGAGGAKCPTCHTSLQYSTTPRPLPALCSRHTTYPVLCLAALAHRAGAGDAAAENVPSTHTLLESQLQIAASLLSHTIHVSFMYDSDWPSHIRRKKRRKKFWWTVLHYRMHLWIENRLQGSQPHCCPQQLLKMHLQKTTPENHPRLQKTLFPSEHLFFPEPSWNSGALLNPNSGTAHRSPAQAALSFPL